MDLSCCEDIKNELIKRKTGSSYQRIKVSEYLIKNQNHTTVERIFSDLQKKILTLSKSTVCNTLNSFLGVQLLRIISIENKETGYDPSKPRTFQMQVMSHHL